MLYGPGGCGKTHLLEVWRRQSGALELAVAEIADVVEGLHPAIAAGRPVVLDDADKVCASGEAQDALFHLINMVRDGGTGLLLAAATPPARWPLTLADLRSRLNAAQLVAIGQPDDILLTALMKKLFRDRQLRVSNNVIDYLMPRIDRSFESVLTTVERLDRLALSHGRAVTRDLAKSCLAYGQDC